MPSFRNNPLVSVILPTYNRAKLLDRAMRSILSQDYSNLELIVVDDCSTDETRDVVAGFCDEKIKYYRQEKRRGAAAARNRGIKESRGEYIAFQDSDDEWLPGKLSRQMAVFLVSPPEVGVVYSSFYRIEGGKKFVFPKTGQAKGGNIHRSLMFENFVTTQAAVVRRTCFEKVGFFDESMPRLQDWELWIRISRHFSFEFVNDPLINTYRTSDSISVDRKALFEAHKLILHKHSDEIIKDDKLFARHSFSIGNTAILSGETSIGRRYILRAWFKDLFNFKYLFAFIVSLLGRTVFERIEALMKRLVRDKV